MTQGAVQPGGTLDLAVHRANGTTERPEPRLVVVDRPHAGTMSLREIIHHGCARVGLPAEVNRWRRSNFGNLLRGAGQVLAARRLAIPTLYGALWLTHHRADRDELDLGLASLRVVTTAGVNYLVDALQNLTEPENFKFHGLGTGTNAEASSDTALQTELTTQYATDNTRPTGTQIEGASANIYRTVATITPDSGFPIAVTEHGILSQAATGGGTLLDRSVFAAVNLASGDAITATYDLTIAAGG